MSDKTIRKQVEAIKRRKIVSNKVVNLSDFRALKKEKSLRTVLVVDDDEIMRSALKRILEGNNLKVILAEDGLELSQILETTHLDMVLLDVNLPWVDGFELCRLIKSHQTLSQVPLIMVTARKSDEDVKNGMDAGADDYVTKPFDIEHILGIINKMFLKKSS